MKRKSKHGDTRSSLLNETIKGARTIKLYGWEKVAMQKVAQVRAAEVHELKVISWLQAMLTFFMSAFPKLALAGSLLLYIEVNGNLATSRALAIAGLFEMLSLSAQYVSDLSASLLYRSLPDLCCPTHTRSRCWQCSGGS